MTKHPARLLVMILVIGLSAACGSPSSGGEATIKIGFFGPLSGDSASDGTNARNAAQLAVNQANTDNLMPGKKFELVAYDDRLDAAETTSLAQKLIDQDKVKAVIAGSYSMPSRTAAPIFQQAGIPMVAAYAVHPEITKAGNMIFRMIYTGPTQGTAMAIFAMDKLSYKTFHLLYLDNDYGKSISEGFQTTVSARGGQVVSSNFFGAKDSDFAAQLGAIKATPADALILVGYYAQSAQILQQARSMGISQPIVGSDGLDSPKLLELAGQAAEGVVLATDFSRNDPRPVVQTFIRNFRTAHNTDPDIVSSSSYDATVLLLDAIKRSGTAEPAAIRDALAATQTFEGVTGNITFTPEREVNKTVLFVKVDKGAFIYLDKLDPSQLQP